jgi:hypothetical protein
MGVYRVFEEIHENKRWLSTLFIWTKEKGVVPLGEGGPFYVPVGISDDGLTIAYNCHEEEGSPYNCGGEEGLWTLKSISRDWVSADGESKYIAYPPGIELSEKDFWASDFFTTDFNIYSAHSSDLKVIGGYTLNVIEGSDPVLHPAIWFEKENRLSNLSGLLWPGDVTAVSPDGKWAGFSNHFGVARDHAYVWSYEYGTENLYQLLKRSDNKYNSSLLTTIPISPSFLTAFSDDNNTSVGVYYSFIEGDEIFGFVIKDFIKLFE